MITYHTNIEQRTPEWHAIRKGKITASVAQAVAAQGKGLDTLIYTIMAEKYSKNEEESYCNEDMLRGIQLEDEAITMFCVDHNLKAEKVGFIELNKYVGFSPDRLIGLDALAEVKCPNNKNYFKLLINGEEEIDTAYLWQSQFQMLISDRKLCYLIFYNPNFDKDIIYFEIKADEEKQAKIQEGIDKGIKMMKDIEKKYLKLIS